MVDERRESTRARFVTVNVRSEAVGREATVTMVFRGIDEWGVKSRED